jgi:hypothetical protein
MRAMQPEHAPLKYTSSLSTSGDAPSVITPFAPCHGAFFMPAATTFVALGQSVRLRTQPWI